MIFPRRFNVPFGEWEKIPRFQAKTLVGLQYYEELSQDIPFSLRHQVPFCMDTKYRKPVLTGDIATRTRELIREICKAMDIEIIKGHVSKDHVHLLLSVPPFIPASDVMKRIKGKSSRKLLSESRILAKKFWGRHLWACGYFCVSSGNVTDDVIAQYIESQKIRERNRDGDFSID